MTAPDVPLPEGFSKEEPNCVGKWLLWCMENDYTPEEVEVYISNGHLFVDTDAGGFSVTMTHEGLTDTHWKKVARLNAPASLTPGEGEERPKITLGDFDLCYKACENCGHDAAKSGGKNGKNRCWKCGRKIHQDFSARALKPEKAHLAPFIDPPAPAVVTEGETPIEVWNPLEHGIKDVPLMVPSHLHNRKVSRLEKELTAANAERDQWKLCNRHTQEFLDQANAELDKANATMTVKTLIKKLQKMPPNALVGFASNDNSEHEIQGWAGAVHLQSKADFADLELSDRDAEALEGHPETWVSIRC